MTEPDEQVEELPELYGEDTKDHHLEPTEQEIEEGHEAYLAVNDLDDLDNGLGDDIEPVEIDLDKELA